MNLIFNLILIFCTFLLAAASSSVANTVFKVHHKFGSSRRPSLSEMKDHDRRRHARILSSVDIFMGGSGDPSEDGLYFAKIGLGTPSKDYYVQVDTGSDILWVNCAGCLKCPKSSDYGIKLSLYDLAKSITGELVTCDEKFCLDTYAGPLLGCKPMMRCQYDIFYGDGSSTTGYFIKDVVHLQQVSDNLQTTPTNGTIAFGCGYKQGGGLSSSSEALDGILGFGQASSSMVSQLALYGKVKKTFAHCLDGRNGGGIFAIGEVVHPKPNTTSLIPNQAHYNVVMKTIVIGDHVIELPTGIFDSGNQKGAIIDSGTTLTYFPIDLYDSIISKIFYQYPDLKIETVQGQYKCFTYTGSVDDGFPAVTFKFKGLLSLTVNPSDYLFQLTSDAWCIGWQGESLQSKSGRDIILLGDLVLSNRLVIYDLENQTIGFTDYNCSSDIQMRDMVSGRVYLVGAHSLSCSPRMSRAGIIIFIFFSLLLLQLLYPL